MTIGFDEIRQEKSPAGTIVTLKIKGKLEKNDYEQFVPLIEGQIKDNSKIRLLVELHEFKGWTTGALWENTKFAAKHFSDIERIAVVGDSRWQKGVKIFIKPFTLANVRYFDMHESRDARKWIREG